jgi:hypothetical protein
VIAGERKAAELAHRPLQWDVGTRFLAEKIFPDFGGIAEIDITQCMVKSGENRCTQSATI